MGILIDPINRTPEWNDKLARDEARRREASTEFERDEYARRRLRKFMIGMSGVLGLTLLFVFLAWLSK
jgi:hypothetical protein